MIPELGHFALIIAFCLALAGGPLALRGLGTAKLDRLRAAGCTGPVPVCDHRFRRADVCVRQQ